VPLLQRNGASSNMSAAVAAHRRLWAITGTIFTTAFFGKMVAFGYVQDYVKSLQDAENSRCAAIIDTSKEDAKQVRKWEAMKAHGRTLPAEDAEGEALWR
jgi:hypothetical protein